jgi:hypothetical protein
LRRRTHFTHAELSAFTNEGSINIMPISVVSNSDQVTVTGPLVVQNDPMGTATTLSLDNGNISTDGLGNLTFQNLITQGAKLVLSNQSAVVNLTSTTTIATAKVISRTSANGAAVTAMTLAAGSVNGQVVIVTNEDNTAANSITFGTTIATNLVFGATASTIAGGSFAIFIWFASLNSGNGAWVRQKAA